MRPAPPAPPYGARVLTPFDDYPIHQTSQPIAVAASGDPNHYDRYFFHGALPGGAVVFGAALGVYPNRQVVDAAFSVARPHEQASVFASGLCPLDRAQTSVGPIGIQVVEPMRTLRVVVDAPAHGLAADLTFRARTAPVAEPPFLRRAGTRTVMDYTRLTQWGAWEGWLAVDGERVDCAPTEVLGVRDRSWGVRPVGERASGAPGPDPQFFWLWAPVSFPDVCTHVAVNEDGDGRRWHESAFVVPVGDAEAVAQRGVEHRIGWRPGTRRAAWCELDLVAPDGIVGTVRLEPVADFQMLGLGYFHPEWGHGVWKGEAAVGGGRWALPVTDPLAPSHLHVQALCRATMGERTGVGILEQLVIGPHAPSGFTDLLDGAR